MEDDYKCEPYYTYTNQSCDYIREYAKFINIDPEKDQDLLYIAKEGLSAPLPKGWLFYRNKNDPNDFFFYNKNTGESIRDHPSDNYYKNLAKEKLEEKYRKLSKKEKNSHKPLQTSQNAENDWEYTSEEPPTIRSFYSNLNKDENKEIPNTKHHKSHSKSKSKDHNSDENNSQYSNSISNKELINEELSTLQKEYQDKKEELERNHQKIIEDLKNEQIKEENLLKAIQTRRVSKENELKNIETKLSTTKNQQNEEIDNISQNFEEEKRRIQNEHNKLIEELNKSNEDEINQIKKDHLNERSQLIKENKIEIQEVKNKLKNKVARMRAKHEKKLAEIRIKAANHLETETKKYECFNQNNKSTEILNKYDEYTKIELNKKKREFEMQLSKLTTLHSEEMAKKNSEYIQFVDQLEQIKQKCNDDIKRTRENTEIEKRNIIRQMKKSILNEKRKEIKEKTKNFVCQTTRIVSIKNNEYKYHSNFIKLRQSNPQSLSIIDDNENNLFYSPSHIVYHHPNYNNYDYAFKYGKKQKNEKKSVDKVHKKHNLVEDKIGKSLLNLKIQMNEIKYLIQEENQSEKKSAFEIIQQMFDMAKNLQKTIEELEMRHYSVVSAMNSIKNNCENTPQQTQTFASPISHQNRYSYTVCKNEICSKRDKSNIKFRNADEFES